MPIIDDAGKRVSWGNYVPGKAKPAAAAPPQKGSQNDPANWSRKGPVTTSGAKMPDQQILDMMRQGGWNVPTVYSGPVPVAEGDKLERTGAPVQLANYDYTISTEEWNRLKSTLEGRVGFTPPQYAKTAEPKAETAPAYPFSNNGTSVTGGATNVAPPDKPELIPNFKMEETTAQPLSYEAYLKLTPDQKAGIDMNALFVNAREKDFKETNKPTDEQRKIYDQEVLGTFGTGRGSEKYAPETVALVKQLNLNIPGMDLDQVLALDYTIDTEDLAKFELNGALPEVTYGPGMVGDPQAAYNKTRTEDAMRLNLIEAVRASKGAIEKAFSDLYNVRGDVVSTMAAGRKADVTSYGGTEMAVPAQAGFPLAYPGGIEPKGLTDDERGKNLFYTAAYEIIANKQKPLTDLWKEVENSPAASDPAELEAMYAYFDQRTRQEAQYGRPKGLGGETYRSPEEIREWMGLDK